MLCIKTDNTTNGLETLVTLRNDAIYMANISALSHKKVISNMFWCHILYDESNICAPVLLNLINKSTSLTFYLCLNLFYKFYNT